MKKFNFLTTTLICSLIAGLGLVACGETSSNPGGTTQETPTTAGEVATRIIVTPPSDAMVGDTINLDDCVEVVGLADENNFEAEIATTSTELATLEGHLLTVTGEGEITVTVTAGSNQKKAKVTFNSLSVLRAAFKEKMTITNQYFLEDINVTPNYQLELTGQGIIHNPKYFATPNQAGTYEGILQAKSGNTYGFACDDLEGTNLAVEPGVQYPINQYYLSMPFSLSYMDLETVYDEETGAPIALSTSDDATIINYCNTSSGLIGPSEYPARLLEYYPDEISGCELLQQELVVEFLPTDKAGTLENALVSILVYGSYKMTYVGQAEPVVENMMLTYAVAHTDPTLGTIKGVEDYIASGEEPEEISIDPFKSVLGNMVEAKNYTQTSKFWWSSSAATNSTPWEETVAGMPNGITVQQFVTENTIFTQQQVDETTVETSFYTVHEGQLYAGDNYLYDENGDLVLDENDNPQYSETLTVTPVEGKTSIWEDETYSLLTVAAAGDDSFYETIQVAAMQEQNGMFAYSFGRNAVLAQAFTANAAGWGIPLYNFFAQNEWFDGISVDVVVAEAAGILQVHLCIGVYVTQTQVGYYHILTQYGNIGTSTAPDLSPLFPAN